MRFLRHAEQRCGDLCAGDGLSGVDTAVGVAGERADRAERIDVPARPVRNGVAVGEAPLRRGVAQLKETAEHRQRLLTADGRGGEEAEPAVAVVAALRYAEGIHGAYAVLRPIGDAAVVCWAENADKQYEDFAAEVFFGDNVDKSDEQRLSALRTSLKLLADGLPCKEMDLDPERKFYILGISPNAARLAVRFFYCDSFGNIVKNIKAHYDRLEIVRPSNDKYPMLPLWKLLSATNRTIKKKNDNGTNAERPYSEESGKNKDKQEIGGYEVRMPEYSEESGKNKDKPQNSAMAGAVARAVFSGGRYPASLLECTFLRIKAERNITRERAAIIKAYYLRNPNEKCPKEVLTVSLNENSKNIPYTLGRLFSVYEEIQQAANPGINTTIKHRYFGSAAAMPATVFPILSNLAQKHLRKLSDAQRVYLDKKVMTLKSVLGEQYPAHMSLPEQGSFDLGYYHQTQARYTKKEDK